MSTTPPPLKSPSAGMTPIEALVELLPKEHFDALRKIHLASQAQRWQDQLDLLDKFRRTISGCRTDPAYDARTRERFGQSLHLIDAERANAKDRLACTATPGLTVGPVEKASMPEPMVNALTDLRTRAGSLDAKMAHEAAMYITRVQMASKNGAFDLVERYSERFVEQVRQAHLNSPQPLLGPVAVKAREIAEMAKALNEGQKLAVPQSRQPVEKASEIKAPTPGGFLFDALRGSSSVEPSQHSKFRPH